MKNLRLTAAILILLSVLIGVCGWLMDGYDAGQNALEAMMRGETNGRMTAFVPEEVKAGLIFYPGGLLIMLHMRR